MIQRIAFLSICLYVLTAVASAQSEAWENEIDGFRFSTDKRVAALHLLSSTREDVMAAFGKDCLNGCRFNDDWDISFAYVGSNWSYSRMENGIQEVLRPNPAYIDKLADINFKPRRVIVLPGSVSFPSQLKCDGGISIRYGQEFKSNYCSDNRSLTYFFYGEIDPHGTFQKNQIQQITYTTIPTTRLFTSSQ